MLTAYAKTCVQPAYNYFEEKFSNDLDVTLSVFKYACYFDPVKIGELEPSAADLDNLKVFTFLAGDGQIDGLKTELPRYMALAEGVSTVVNKIEWWQNHTDELPKWSSACKLILLIQPSSAAAERVFSLLSTVCVKKTFPISCGFVSENGNYRSMPLPFLTAVPLRFVLSSVLFRFVSFRSVSFRFVSFRFVSFRFVTV